MPYARPWQVRTMKGLLESTPAEVVAKRSSMLQTLIGKIAELKYEEENLRTGMPEHVKHIMKGKRLLLFEFLLKGAGIEDPEMMRSLMEGFPLVGQLPSAGWFPCRKESVDVVELTDLLKESAWRIPQLEA
eukprot:4505340-Amphidinium_carterae.1